MSRHVARLLVFALLLVALLAPIGRLAAVGPIVTPGTIPTAQIKGVVKFRNFAPLATGFDVQIGPSEAVSANNGGDANYPWGAVNAVSFAYNGNQLAAGFPTLNGGSPNTVTYPGALSGPLNYLQIDVVCRDPGATVALKNVMVAGTSLGDFMPATCGGAGDTHSWYVTGLDLSAGFQLTGAIHLSGFAGLSGQETSKVLIRVGTIPATPATAAVTFTPAAKALVCNATELRIDFRDMPAIYGYQFKVQYDEALLDAVGAFDNSWFNTTNQANVPGGWGASCAAGVCKFAVSKVNPATPVSGSGPVGKITFTAQAAGVSMVQLTNLIVTDLDGFSVPAAAPLPVELTTCGRASISGKVSLQGRVTPIDGGEVRAIDAGGVFPTVTVPFDAAGNYTLSNLPVLPGGSSYKLRATHILYLGNEKTLALSPGAALTNQNTRLLGGDADNSGLNPPGTVGVDVGDLSCVAGAFDGPPLSCGPFPLSSTDINKDNVTNIQDLAITGGNYARNPFQPW
ncbi:MAG TPA: cohesin domain-containing protein [Promineifilum sp.]|nr:cohesin domain-containing protein [Promineifilum sp.]